MVRTTDEPALVVDNVSKTFGSKTAVDRVSFSLPRGEVLALLGPNGAGKTTTVEMCEGFQTPSSGSIRTVGLDPATSPMEVRERVGIMLQGGGGYSGLSVIESLRLAASYSANPHDPEWLISLLGLEGVRSTTYRRLSGGQQQRVSLALALIGRPELVFLDEPTAGMDAQSRHRVWDIVRALKRDGVSVLITTHLMDEAELLADTVVIVDKGSVVASGSPATLTQSVAQGIQFETLTPIPETSPLYREVTALKPTTYRYEHSPSPETIARLAADLAREDIQIRTLEAGRSSLEAVFLSLTGRELRS
ncbi:ABC transporter ATP-binding protein [Corynebacterium tapiri]|uniref:ABC transporter ATP-binding protein n=1 Tax=Corynebacterium tapiri TaxID=1448266 RepID=A0A5C4U4J3_9CORY|nr:ABC transporter ATP-binding protein [Corynebacterium tapiri]TNL97575.1 ABC transporter ATP-binding protein [Corynebacterium tapiri]